MISDSKGDNLSVYCYHLLYTNNDFIRNVTILLTICLICFIAIPLVMKKQVRANIDEYDYNYTEYNFGDYVGKYKIYYRKDWGGSPPKLNTVLLKHPVKLVIISHTTTLSCNSTEKCCTLVRKIQTKHFETPVHSVDIGYNFLIGGDGNIYVGRGWNIQNYHKRVSIGISFIGNFDFDVATEDMIESAKKLIKSGLELKKIASDYVLVGENQTNSRMFLSPGVNVFKEIKNWPHFYNGTLL